MSFEIIRDPLWNNIAVDSLAMRLVDARESLWLDELNTAPTDACNLDEVTVLG